MDDKTRLSSIPVTGAEHWTDKSGVKLFLWNKYAGEPAKSQPRAFPNVTISRSLPSFC